MENLILSAKVIFPLFLMLSLGYFLRHIHLWDEHTVTKMNNVTFRTFLPVLLFSNIYHTDLEGILQPKLLWFTALSVLAAFLIATVVVLLLEKDNRKRGVMIQGIFRSNFIIFGVPVTQSLYGKDAGGIAALLIGIVIPMYNFLSVFALEIFRKKDGNQKTSLMKILKGIITNPLILGSLSGLLFLGLNIKIPQTIDGVIQDIAAIATPMALMILGASFVFSKVKNSLKQLILSLCGKLIFLPLIFMPISIFLGFRNEELVTLLTLFASPTAVSAFTMAQQMDGDSELAGQQVVLGSVCSMFTIFFWILILKQLSLI